MHILQQIRKDDSAKTYWESLLGEEMLSKILSDPEYQSFLNQEVSQNQTELQDFLKPLTREEKTDKREEWIFYPFYCRICYCIQRKLDKVFQKRHLISDREKVSHALSQQYTKKIQEIPLRCLLQEMEERKQKQQLSGENPKQQYDCFLREYLDKEEFLTELAEKYPVMQELIFQKTEAFALGLEEMLSCFEQEKTLIENHLCHGEKINCIQNIETGLSDEHSPGKTVTRLDFDNGITVYYKPRCLKSEQEYQRLYHQICKQCGLKNYDRGILDCGTHGWEEAVTPKACKNREQVSRYYERMGIHLCLSYLFGVSDIHFENIIACGEYPLLIDMEVFPGYRKCFAEGEGTLPELLGDSVLGTGILPGRTWGNAMVNVSAMGSVKKQKTPFKIPVIKEKNTSNMHISYEYAELQGTDCIPELDGQKIEAAAFLVAVEKGFEEAYECIFRCREEWLEKISAMQLPKSRHVIRHTQEYRMYQMITTFPEFMKEPAARALMLLRMEKGLPCEEEQKKKLLFYEAETINKGCFPVYYVRGRSLETGNGECISDYFADTVQEQITERLKKMNPKDKYRQQKLIALSMSSESKSDTEHSQSPGNSQPQEDSGKASVTVHQIAECIQKDTEKIAGEAQWIRLKYAKEGGWQFQTMGMYLYDGIAGIAVFLMAYGWTYGMEKYKELRGNIIQQMFSYTDRGVANAENLESRHTGIMSGESSVVYTYLVLYRISREAEFLDYAKKHAKIVVNLLKEDRQYDILEGNAGAVIALLHLYGITESRTYLEQAQQAAELLLTHAVQMEKGIGWLLPGQSQPLAGFAHGNSGIMLAFARLWEATGIARYCAVIEQIREYEDSLYDENMGNWQDIRGTQKGSGRDVTAWCHGAAGILIATAQTDCIMGTAPDEDWRCRQAERKISNTKKGECCLCHGRMGNAAALRYGREGAGQAEKWMTSEKRSLPEYLEVPAWEEIPVGERYQMGFMTGLSGIGYELLRRKNPQLPEILAMELDRKGQEEMVPYLPKKI